MKLQLLGTAPPPVCIPGLSYILPNLRFGNTHLQIESFSQKQKVCRGNVGHIFLSNTKYSQKFSGTFLYLEVDV